MNYSIEQIASIIGATPRSCSTPIHYITTDTRSISFPADTLFVALTTTCNDGHRYIPDAYRQGVRFFIVNRAYTLPEESDDAHFLAVDDPLKALQALATYHRKQFDFPLWGITGSNGKTIVKEWLYQLFHQDFEIIRSPRSYNSQIGVPLSLLSLEPTAQLGIFEAGISQPEEMDKLEKMIKPDLGILTNIGEAHQENFSSMQEKCIEKCRLFQEAHTLIYDTDEVLINRAIKMSRLACQLIGYSRKDRNAYLYIEHIEKEADHTSLRYSHCQKPMQEIRIPFTDDASIANAVTCLTVALYQGMDESTRVQRFAHLEPVAMRLEVKEGINQCLLIDDSYNSDLRSLEIALDFQRRKAVFPQDKRIVILSDILQSGRPAHELYQKVARLMQGQEVAHFIGIGPEIQSQASLFPQEAQFFPDTNSFIRSGMVQSFQRATILIKGARSFHFEQIFESLSHKVHETILEINLNHLIDNFHYYRSLLKKETRMVAMVKASAYGAGGYEIAKTLQDQHCDYLAVAVADEGVELRKAGIHIPIMIMNPEMSSFPMLFEYKLEPEVYSFKLLHALIETAQKAGITHYPIHLKLDTGMHRLGFLPEEIDEVIRIVKSQDALQIRSVFSHFAGSDSPVFDTYTRLQIDRFEQATQKLQASFSHKILRHILNTAGIERFPEKQMDMVRLGIGLYGVSPLEGNHRHLKNVSTLKTTILQIKELEAGETIGYSRKEKLSRHSRIAAIPIGYADGLNRHLGNRKGKVWVKGQLVPIVGNICMDVTLIDVTDTQAQEGDCVILFGEEQPVSQLAEQLQTIPYEILTSVSPRVKRVFYQE